MIDIIEIEQYMSTWGKYTYIDGLNFYKSISTEVKEATIGVLERQGLAEKKMDGASVQKIPYKTEGKTNIVFSYVFFDAIQSGYITPAAYCAKVVEQCIDQNISKDSIVYVLGRGLRSLPSFIREMDLAAQMTTKLPGANFLQSPKQDIQEHTDIQLEYAGNKYRIWSYQSSDRGLKYTAKRIRGDRGELPTGIHVLCPINTQDPKQRRDVSGWFLYSEQYIAILCEVLRSAPEARYSEIQSKTHDEMDAYLKNGHSFDVR